MRRIIVTIDQVGNGFVVKTSSSQYNSRTRGYIARSIPQMLRFVRSLIVDALEESVKDGPSVPPSGQLR